MDGWYYYSPVNYNEVSCRAGDKLKNLTTIDRQNVYLYCNYQEFYCTIKLVSKYGRIQDDTLEVLEGKSISSVYSQEGDRRVLPELSANGYKFIGWSLEEGGEEVTLKPCPYAARVEVNGYWSYLYFAGWAKRDGGEAEYSDCGKYTLSENGVYSDDYYTYLYATWKKEPYATNRNDLVYSFNKESSTIKVGLEGLEEGKEAALFIDNEAEESMKVLSDSKGEASFNLLDIVDKIQAGLHTFYITITKDNIEYSATFNVKVTLSGEM